MSVPIIASDVLPADIFADQQLFADHPSRRYRIGERFVVRRRARGVFLRAPLPPDHHCVDTEAGAEFLWWLAAWPALTPKARAEAAKAARQRGRP